jgi:GNAT superfamily N-acetyltransferase
MLRLRPFEHGDLESLYDISLATGLSGTDASAFYEDRKLIGHLYSAPYALLGPGPCFVAEDDQGVCGFVLGATDTAAFEDQLEREWWPHLRATYPDPSGIPPSAWTPDQRRCFAFHHPRRTPGHIIETYPAHMHMNLLPRIQGQGIGRTMLDMWLNKARPVGVHVGCNPQNHRAINFWEKQQFRHLAASPSSGAYTVWLGRA